ncbi:MAG: chemotaxis protein CheW [Vicinamibacterales bacterium]
MHRNAIMPLINLDAFFGVEAAESGDVRQVIVFRSENGNVGLVVDQILDIVSEAAIVQETSRREGVLGSAVLQQKVTDLVDVAAIIRASCPSFAKSAA